MKQLSVLFLLIITIGLGGCQNKDNTKRLHKNTGLNETEFARGISEKLLQSQKDGGYYSLTKNEATDEMISGLNEERQKQSYTQIKAIFGDYQSLQFDTLVEIHKNNIYRFKGEFEMSNEIEIRTVLNADGKLAGFFVRPWKENL